MTRTFVTNSTDALANHGYFPHSGVVPLTTGATATEKVYGKGDPSDSAELGLLSIVL